MITFLIVAYIVVALGVYFVPAFFGEDGDGAIAIFWLPCLALVLGGFLILAPFAGLGWINEQVRDWSLRREQQRRLRKLEEAYRQQEIAKVVEKLPETDVNLIRVDEQYPNLTSITPANYRHMNCNSCGHPIDKDTDHVDDVVIRNIVEKQ